MTAGDFLPLVGRRVLVAGEAIVIGANGDTVLEAVEAPFAILRTGKETRRVIRCAHVATLTALPEPELTR